MHLTLAGGRLWRKLMSICEHKRAPVEHIILFFPSGDLVSEVWVDMSVEKRFRRCVDPCQRCLTLDHTHDLCVMCLGEEHARSVLEGMECVHCEHFFCGKKLRSRLSLFLERIGAIICPPRLGSSRCWGSGETEFAAIGGWREWTAGEDVLSVTSSDPSGSALLAHGVRMKAERIFLSLLSLSAPRYRAEGGYEACASARYSYSGGTEKGEWLAVDLMSDLSLA